MAKWGFDLTDFGTDTQFKKILKKHNLKKHIRKKKVVHYDYGDKDPYHAEYFNYQWANPKTKLKIITGNNALTGEYSSPKQRPKQKGYASYIGIEGSKKDVTALKNTIKKMANYYKDESPHKRDFI